MTLRPREHPQRETLFEFAEQLESGRVAFGSDVAAHVRECHRCGGEVQSIRRSLSVAKLASQTIEPTISLEASTILAMKSQRVAHRRQVNRRAVKAASFAAAFTVTMSVCLSSSTTPAGSDVNKTYPRSGELRLFRTIEALQMDSPEEILLEPAIRASNWQPQSAWEKAQRRALDALDHDIDEALAAIQANPALVRAGMVIDANRETKRRTLKTLYAQRNL
jgi:hypothetical protein